MRPTLVFGPDDILVGNIAWILRRMPLFLVAGDGRYEVQPVSVNDTARICVEAGEASGDVVVDAAGPESFAFEPFVRLIAAAVGSRARIRTGPAWLALTMARALGPIVHDVMLTRDELEALMAGLLISHEPPRGRDRFEAWLAEAAGTLGRSYTSELARNFDGTA